MVLNHPLPDYYYIDLKAPPAHWVEMRELMDEYEITGTTKAAVPILRKFFPEEFRSQLKSKKTTTIRFTYVVDERHHPFKEKVDVTDENGPNEATSLINKDGVEAEDNTPKRKKGRPQKFDPLEEMDGYESDGEAVTMYENNEFSLKIYEIHLTYRSHHDPVDFSRYFGKLMASEGNGVTFYSIVNETALPRQYKHTHAYLRFRNEFDVPRDNFFDYDEHRPNIKIPRKVPAKCSSRLIKGSGADIACRYHLKEKNSLRSSNYPICDKPVKYFINDEWKIMGYEIEPGYDTGPMDGLRAWIIEQQSPRPDSKSIAKTFSSLDIINNNAVMGPNTKIEKPFPWQRDVMMLVKAPDKVKRCLLWVFDPAGGNGKTSTSEHMEDNMNAIVIPLAKAADMSRLAKKAFIKNPNPDFIIFDLAKSTSNDSRRIKERVTLEYNGEDHQVDVEGCYDNHDFYVTLEKMRDGELISTKYDSHRHRFNKVPIIVMSNYRPNVKEMIEDRWTVMSLSFDKTLDVIITKESGKDVVRSLGRALSMLGKQLPNIIELDSNDTDMTDSVIGISLEIKDFYWSRGYIPIFGVDSRCRCEMRDWSGGVLENFVKRHRRYSLECRPMTEEELKDYSVRKARLTLTDDKKTKPITFHGVNIEEFDLAYGAYLSDKTQDISGFGPSFLAYLREKGHKVPIQECEKNYKYIHETNEANKIKRTGNGKVMMIQAPSPISIPDEDISVAITPEEEAKAIEAFEKSLESGLRTTEERIAEAGKHQDEIEANFEEDKKDADKRTESIKKSGFLPADEENDDEFGDM